MGMGLLRWLIWPRRAKDDEDERPSKRFRPKPRPKSRHPGVYRIEVDNEVGRFHGDGAPFSFWSSSRVILILSFLLWWIQPAGPMIAGYVGGRRAGSPIKAVIAALMPVFAIYIANLTYAHNFASHQMDFVAMLPMVVSDAAASILPFLLPYKEFMVAYMQGFAQALTTTFGMGTNGYLMVVIFAYIGGLIAEQTRRELGSRSGSGSSVGVNLVQPLLGARPYVDDEEQAYEEDEEIHRSHRPTRARSRGHPVIAASGHQRRGRDRGDHFDSFRKLTAEPDEVRGRRSARAHRRDADNGSEDDEAEEFVATRTHRISHAREEEESPRVHRRPAHAREESKDDEEEERAEAPARHVPVRSQAEERAIQRFVERALRNYDHAKL